MREAIINRAIDLYNKGLDWKSYLQKHCLDDTQLNKNFKGVKTNDK